VPKDEGIRSEIEELPTMMEMLQDEGSPACDKDKIADIKCQTAHTKISYKEVGGPYSFLFLILLYNRKFIELLFALPGRIYALAT
jgi:hypothetical protein